MDKKLVVYMRISLVFFFFKQKTAYEMRISDWSSDVCSSDLGDEYGCCHACVQRRSKQSDTAPPRWFSRCSVRLMRHPLLIGRRIIRALPPDSPHVRTEIPHVCQQARALRRPAAAGARPARRRARPDPQRGGFRPPAPPKPARIQPGRTLTVRKPKDVVE